MGMGVTLRGRSVVLTQEGQEVLCVPLDRGGRYRMVASDTQTQERWVHALEALPDVAVLSPDGGLLGGMTVGANLSLALAYGREADDEAVRDWEGALHQVLQQWGMTPQRIQQCARTLPVNLDRVERWMLGFSRYMLRPPELLVLDRACAGLGHQPLAAVLAIESLYHTYHPFRPTLFVDVDAPGLPPLPDCRASYAMEPAPCPS